MVFARKHAHVFILIITLSLFFNRNAEADIDPRIKALGTMAVYGTVGGALLGTALLAFDGNGRTIAKGASLGLYAGIIFGSYVVGSHYYKKKQVKTEAAEEYDDGPVEDEADYDDGSFFGGWGSSDEEDDEEQDDSIGPRHWNPYQEIESLRFSANSRNAGQLRPQKQRPVYYINILSYQF